MAYPGSTSCCIATKPRAITSTSLAPSRLRALANGRGWRAAARRDCELGGERSLARRRTFGRRRADAARHLCLGRRVRGAELRRSRRSGSSPAPSSIPRTARRDEQGQGTVPGALVAAQARMRSRFPSRRRSPPTPARRRRRRPRCRKSRADRSPISAVHECESADSVRRVALKKLFADPHFNVEDLNEAYSGDWTGGEPITQEMLARLNQARMHLLSDDERLKLEADEAQAAEQERQAHEASPPTQSTQEAIPMSLDGKTLKVCSCNRTVALDARALAAALKTGAPLTVHHELCRKDAGAFQAALGDPDVIVACTQEAALFGELAEAAGTKAGLKFVNVREAAGWSAEAKQSTPKIAALVAMAALPDAAPSPAVEFKSAGQVLIIGPGAGRSTGQSGCQPARGLGAPHERRRRAAVRARLSGVVGRGQRAFRLARRLRGRVAPEEPDRPGALHALQRVRARMSGKRDRFQLPDRPFQVQVAPGLRDGLRRDRRHRLRPRRHAAQRVFDLILDLSREPLVAAGRRRRAISRRGTIRSSRRSPRAHSRHWSASSRSRSFSTTTQRSARTAARAARGATTASMSARPAQSRPMAIMCGWNRTSARAAAGARPCARRAR